MDQALRELERQCEASRGEATLWAKLAKARLRAGLRPAEALAAVRSGLRAGPACEDVARARDEALGFFWQAPSFRELWGREVTSGERVVFSHDGSRVALVSRGVLVFKTDENEIAGAGLPGHRFYAAQFLGEDVLLAQQFQLVLFSPKAGRVQRVAMSSFDALATAKDGSRAVVHLQRKESTVLRVVLDQRGKLRQTLELALQWNCQGGASVGPTPDADEVVLASRERFASFSGERFDRRIFIPTDFDPMMGHYSALLLSPRHVVAVERSGRARIVARAGGGSRTEDVGSGAALTPDGGVLLGGRPDGVVYARLDGEPGTFRLPDWPHATRVVAASPCGSRLALLRENSLVVLEAS